MTIKNGEVANADEVMNAMASIWNDTAQNLFNTAYLGFDSKLAGLGSPQLENVDYDIYEQGDEINRGNAVSQYNFSGGFNSAYWTAATGNVRSSVTQTGGYIQLYGTGNEDYQSGEWASITSVPTSIPIENGAYFFKYYYDLDADSSGSPPCGYNIKITDGTNSVTIKSQSSRTDISGTLIYRLNIDKTNETCYLTENIGDSTKTGIDLSALNNAINWKIIFETVGGYSAGDISRATFRLYSFNRVSTTATEKTISLADTESRTNLIPILNLVGNGTTSLTFSNDGTNYETLTNKSFFRPSYTGTTKSIKINMTASDAWDLIYVPEYAIKYNLY